MAEDPSAPTGSKAEAFLSIDGMMCGSCAAAVEAILGRQPGVISANVNFAADAAHLLWDPERTSLRNLLDPVNRLGYRAAILGENGRQSRLDKFQRLVQIRLAVAVMFGMWSVLTALVLYLQPGTALPSTTRWWIALFSGVFAVPVLTYSGAPFYVAGWRTLRAGVPGMDTLISLGALGAVLLSTGHLLAGSADVYFDTAVMLITFQLVARQIDHRVRRGAAHAAQTLLHPASEPICLVEEDGQVRSLSNAMVRRGMLIRVADGERIGVDGTIENGCSAVDTSLLTGESKPVPVSPGDKVYAGTTNGGNTLLVRVGKPAGRRRVDEIARSVRTVLTGKTSLQRTTDQVARALLPGVVLLAAACTMFGWMNGLGSTEVLRRTLTVLVITCPCALSLAVPLVTLLAESRARKTGILFRDPSALEQAAAVRHIVFDKTGTVTGGRTKVRSIEPAPGWSADRVLYLAATATAGSDHPLAAGLAAAVGGVPAAQGMRSEVPGMGVELANSSGAVIRVGREEWLRSKHVETPKSPWRFTEACVAVNDRFAGRITFTEEARPEAAPVIRRLKRDGLAIHLLSGDSAAACNSIAKELDIPQASVRSGQTPESKLAAIGDLQVAHGPIAFVGDGLNDGPALAAAAVGIAVGEATSTARAAAAVLMPRGMNALPDALRLAKRARRIMRQNVTWAVAYNFLALPAAFLGLLYPAVAAAAMGLSSICMLANTARLSAPGDSRKPARTP